MKRKPNPPRLVDTPEFREILGPLCTGDFDAKRMERNRIALLERIDAAAEDTNWLVSFGQLFKSRRLAFAIGLLLFTFSAGLGAYMLYRKILQDDDTAIVPPAAIDKTKTDPERKIRKHPAVDPVEETTPSEPLAMEIPKTVEEKPPAHSPSEAKPTADSSGSDDAEGAQKSKAKSQLDEQLTIFRAAKQAARNGQLDLALRRLAELQRKFPRGALDAEASTLTVRCLYRAGRYKKATKKIEALLSEPLLGGRKAQLLRLLGDIQVRQGKCEQAAESYQRAIGLGLMGAQAEAARRGLKKCSPL